MSRRYELKKSLLKRAFKENRGGDVILLIQWRTAAASHAGGRDEKNFAQFKWQNVVEPREVIAENLNKVIVQDRGVLKPVRPQAAGLSSHMLLN